VTPVYIPLNPDDEDGLIGRCLAGETAAFEPLVARYHRPLFGAAVRLLGSREEALDVTQTVFLKAYQALATCDRQRRFFSWIYRILLNECLNVIRARRPVEALPDELAAPVSGSDPVDQAETRQRVRQALLQLTETQRDVIVMRHFAEMSYDEIALALDVPEKTVKSRLFSARQRLCEILITDRT
jgi:RNA polymerase sigma-70 factor (ECF subfamily)